MIQPRFSPPSAVNLAHAEQLRVHITDYLASNNMNKRVFVDIVATAECNPRCNFRSFCAFLDGDTHMDSEIAISVNNYLKREDHQYAARKASAEEDKVAAVTAHLQRVSAELINENHSNSPVRDEKDGLSLDEIKQRCGFVSPLIAIPSALPHPTPLSPLTRGQEEEDWLCSKCKWSNVSFEDECAKCNSQQGPAARDDRPLFHDVSVKAKARAGGGLRDMGEGHKDQCTKPSPKPL